MKEQVRSIRPFIGAKDFDISRRFYKDLGFKERVLFHNMSRFAMHDVSFYLQDAYVADWVDNSQVFMEVADLESFWHQLSALDLTSKYEGVRLTPIREFDWGKECYLHDPSGILWHFGEFPDTRS